MGTTAILEGGVRGRSAKPLTLVGRSFRLALMSVALVSHVTCSSTTAEPKATNPQAETKGRTLIVYLSRTENTKAVADMIRERVGGYMVAVEPCSSRRR